MTLGGDRSQGAATCDTERETEGEFSPVCFREQVKGEGFKWRPGMKEDTSMKLAYVEVRI